MLTSSNTTILSNLPTCVYHAKISPSAECSRSTAKTYCSMATENPVQRRLWFCQFGLKWQIRVELIYIPVKKIALTALPPLCNLGGCNPEKAESPQVKQNPGCIDFQCPGESKWRDSNPRPFGPEFEDLDFRPSNANFRHFPPVVQ